MDHYKILGVSNTCNDTEIKQAYRALSFKYHPDRNKESDASKKMQSINEAYEILSDKNKRKQYDIELNGGVSIDNIMNDIFANGGLHNLFNRGGFHGNVHHFQTGGHPAAFEVMFSNEMPHIFKERIQPPPILEKKIDITFEDSYRGNIIPFVIEREIKMGNLSYNEEEKVYIPIQKGIDDGEILLVKDKGNIFNDTKGDLKLYIHVLPNSDYERKGLNIIKKHNLTFKESICGFELIIKHIDGTSMKLVSSRGNIIQNGDEHLIKNKGFTRDNQTGDLIISFKVVAPKTLTEEQLNLFDNILL